MLCSQGFTDPTDTQRSVFPCAHTQAYTRDVDRLASGEGGAADLDNAESTDVTARVVLVRLLRYYLREAVRTRSTFRKARVTHPGSLQEDYRAIGRTLTPR